MFAGVSPEERKAMLQKCIADIVIDREAMVARFGTWGIPAVTPETENALKSIGNEGIVMSCQSARNPNFRSLTQLHRVIEMPLSK
jgi:hypothetical protein